MDKHFLRLDRAEAVIAARGAELQSLRLQDRDLLWDAGSLWPRHAPLLFPIVGGLKGEAYRHGGATFSLPRHGFARDRDFTWLRREAASCALELRDDAASRAFYPFAFRLEVSYKLGTGGLRMELMLENPSEAPLPASLGLHPAFRWPLAPGIAKRAHRLVFEADEPGSLRRLDKAGLLLPAPRPSPIRDRRLTLDEGLFSDDALILLEPRSRSLHFEAEGGPALALRWEGFPHLGLWTKPDPGPSFLCIEPWEGHASPADWDGELADKPGAFVLPPGAIRRWSFGVELEA
jgi:galactose mutarotase-like enzyme